MAFKLPTLSVPPEENACHVIMVYRGVVLKWCAMMQVQVCRGILSQPCCITAIYNYSRGSEGEYQGSSCLL